MPPFALPKHEYMERAQKFWEEWGSLPCGRSRRGLVSLGRLVAGVGRGRKRAATGGYLENGRISAKLKRKGLKPETKFRPDKDGAKSGNGNV